MSANKKILEPIMEAFGSVGEHMVRIAGVTHRHRNKHTDDLLRRNQVDQAQAGRVPSGGSGDGSSVPDSPGPGIHLKYKRGWSKAQRDAADAKVAVLQELAREGRLIRIDPQEMATRPSNLRRLYQSMTGADMSRLRYRRYDVDHIIDLQFGGDNDRSNFWLLDRSVNRSLGAQIARQLKNFDIGDTINEVTIRPR